MHEAASVTVIFVVITVLLFMFLGIAILVIIDHKARIPGEFHRDPFSISGLRRDHPVIGFLTTIILLSIIAALIFEITFTLGRKFGWLEKKAEPELAKQLKAQRVTDQQRHFHNEPKVNLVTLGKKTVCFHCHGDYAHHKERMVRTLLNMHTQFIGCMTCHSDNHNVKQNTTTFAWLNYSGIDVSGKPYGVELDPETGFLAETDDYYSKIVAYKGGQTLLEIPETDAKAQAFISNKDSLSETDKKEAERIFHAGLGEKGVACVRCHSQEDKNYLPLRELGFSDRRVTDINNLNIAGLVQKYNKFYIPKLFEPFASENEAKGNRAKE